MVSNRTLLGIAGFVWLAAGVNILRIGVKAVIAVCAASKLGRIALMVLLAAAIFTAFHRMFSRIVQKHTARIRGYETRQPFWRFFDGKSYLLMIFMMSLGIGQRFAAGVLLRLFLHRSRRRPHHCGPPVPDPLDSLELKN